MSNLVRILAQSFEQVLAFADPQNLTISEDAASPLPSEIVWMPAGTHSIMAHTLEGGSYVGKVVCDAQAARAVSASFEKITATGQRVWLDFDHSDGKASAWVKGFSWDAARGILAQVEWTADGASALRGKSYYSFSPAFAAEKGTGRVVSLLQGHAAGGLVNAPAFGAMPALIAARMSGFTSQTATGGKPAQETNTNIMKDMLIKLLAALKVTVPADATEEQLVALFAKHSADSQNAELASLKTEIESVQAALAAKAKAEKDAADAKKRAEEEAVLAKAKKDAEAKISAEFAEIKAQLAAIKAGAVASVAGPSVDGLVLHTNPFEAIRAMAKETDPVKRGRIFCNDLRKFTDNQGVHEIMAANSFGTLTGDLVVLKALDLLKLRFPILSRVSTDFSAQQVKYGQSVKTRIITVPTVTTYNTTTGYAASDMTTTDVAVTINAHKGITVLVNANDAGSTGRDLFGEQVNAMNYALGKDLVDALYALFVAATYTNTTTTGAVNTTNFTRALIPIVVAQAFNTRGVPQMNRTLLLNAAAFAALSSDPTIVSLAVYQKPEVITSYTLPELSGIQPIEAINLPSTGNMVGFALTPDAAAIATRLPLDYSTVLPGSSYGNVQTVTNPDLGISVLKTDFVDHKLGTANSRIAWMYGVAAGQVASAQLLKTA